MKLRGNFLLNDGEFSRATVEVNGETITAIDHEGGERAELPYIVPGFIDQHCHGGGGGSFDSADKDSIQRAIDFHRKCGTTSIMASLVSANHEALLQQIAALVPFVKSGEIIGIHLEGPWINPERKGAHDPNAIRDFDLRELEQIMEVGHGVISMITIAPEIPGALLGISVLKRAGVSVAIGHTNATIEQTQLAINAGASIATHLFNAMPQLESRDPGPIGAFLSQNETFIELIADLQHVHPAVLEVAIKSAGVNRTALITDSMCAAGCAPGVYKLGNLDVEVDENKARLFDSKTLAGSVLTLNMAVANVIDKNIATLAQAATMASRTPARALGLDGVGDIKPGFQADFVIFNPDMSIDSVLRKGNVIV